MLKKIKLSEKTYKAVSGKQNWKFKFKDASTEDGLRYIEGYASTDDLDRVDDVVTLEALKAVAKQIVKKGCNTVLYNHDRDIAIGKVVEATVDSKGLFVKILISNAEDIESIWIKIKEEILNSFSIGFRLKKYEIVEDNGKFVSCKILEIEIYEISVVTVPCNTNANITSVIGKSFTNNKRSGKKMLKQKNVSVKGVMKELLPSLVAELDIPGLVAKAIQARTDAEVAKVAQTAAHQKEINDAVTATLKSLGIEGKKPEATEKTDAVKTDATVKTVVTKKGKKKSVQTDEEDDKAVEIKKALVDLDDADTISFVAHAMNNKSVYVGLNKDEQEMVKAFYITMMKTSGAFSKK